MSASQSPSTAKALREFQEKKMSTKSKIPPPRVYRTKHLKPRSKDDPTVDDRQREIPGFKPESLPPTKVILIGAGGLGGEIGEALVRKGVGTLVIFDHDLVELTNLNRQRFYENDLYKPKAHRLAKNLAKEGFMGS